MFELGEDLLDGIEVGRVLGQEDQFGAGLADRLAYRLALVAAEIIHDDDVARRECRYQHLLDIDAEAFAIDGTVDHPGRVDPVVAQGRQKGCGAPMAEGGVADQALTARAPAPQWRHVGFDPGFINENEPGWVDVRLIFQPPLPPAHDIGAALFVGNQCLFLCVSPCSCTNVQTAQ